jgi:dihydrofolate reductase
MITIIAAVASNGVIGKGNELPWHLSEDLKRFKRLTLNNTVLMGRKTFESIFERLGKPLPKRTSIIITRQSDYEVPQGCFIYNIIEYALTKHSNENVFIIGGATIYKQTMDLAEKLEITHIDQDYEGDTYFPEINQGQWQITNEEKFDGYRFVTYERK